MGDLDRRYLGGGGDQIVHEARRQRLAFSVEHQPLVEGGADSLCHSPADLPIDDQRVDHHPAILGHQVAHDAHLPGGRVDLDHGKVGRRWRTSPAGPKSPTPPARPARPVGAGGVRGTPSVTALSATSPTRELQHPESPALEHHVVGGRLQEMGGDAGEPLHQTVGGLGGRVTRQHHRPAGEGSPAVRDGVGVPLDHPDLGRGQLQPVGDHLGKGRGVPLTM